MSLDYYFYQPTIDLLSHRSLKCPFIIQSNYPISSCNPSHPHRVYSMLPRAVNPIIIIIKNQMYLMQALKRTWSTHPIQPRTGKVPSNAAAMLDGSLLWGYRSHSWSSRWNLTGNNDNSQVGGSRNRIPVLSYWVPLTCSTYV